ncbi:MAG TPA: UDP-N-acetylmuramoyl-L-alanyl-D-glutamate--2,6-diaminopimelate ligase [Actinomycetota bacterium]|nr:UDP-N-acetylmuramoyl-L-alanyl-D-glutamate--2,6-diaminopimelate ligase [Actinomycetota bacterium]
MTLEREPRALIDLAAACGDVFVRAPEQEADRLDDPPNREGSTFIKGLSFDSRAVGPGHLFFCIPGTVADGHAFAAQAVENGAVALCVERPTGAGVPEIVVSDARIAMARIAAEAYGHPGDDLLLLGITGTNGKTTTAFLLDSILRVSGKTTGLIGTIETRIAGQHRPGVRTTPESLDLQALLADMRDEGVTAVAMEVTSHALAMQRVEGLRFEVAAFTNLSQDHLDFHTDMEDYFTAKKTLFTPEHAERGVTNLEDPYGERLFEQSAIPVVGFGHHPSSAVTVEKISSGPWGSEFVIAFEGKEEIKVATPLVGHFNVSNCLAAAATAWQAGIGFEAIQVGIEQLDAVPGRFEAVDMGQPYTVVVDYSHTPDSLDNALRGARSLAGSARVLCAFGCGGDRDRAKRPLMGAVAAVGADFIVVTSDNPRSEDPDAIIGQILEGVMGERSEGPDDVLADRREAIARVLGAAEAGDVVVIAGKGHETGQEFADKTIPFDDRNVAREELTKLGFNKGGKS